MVSAPGAERSQQGCQSPGLTGELMARCAGTPLHQLHKPLPMPRETWRGWNRDAEKSGLSEQLGACTRSPWCLFCGSDAPATAQWMAEAVPGNQQVGSCWHWYLRE